jgi:hypothetical protein
MNSSDPIIAAIEAHRRACAETRAAYERQSAIEDELGAGTRVPAGEVENDPGWIAVNDTAAKALAVQDDLAVKLLAIPPTTIAGRRAPYLLCRRYSNNSGGSEFSRSRYD